MWLFKRKKEEKKTAKEGQEKQFPLPMWRMCCPTVLPFTSDVTLRLLSQWPPLKSNFPSWDTTNRWAVTSTTGENGPARNLWVLQRERASACWCVGYFQESASTEQTGCEDVNRQRLTLHRLRWGLWWRWNSWICSCRRAASREYPSSSSGPELPW